MCWIVGFKTKLLIKTLYRKANQSGCVQFLQVFQSKLITEKESLINNQMKFFVKMIRQCRIFNRYSWTNDFVIYWDKKRRLALTKDEQNNEDILSQIDSEDFWDLWKREDTGDYMFERPYR